MFGQRKQPGYFGVDSMASPIMPLAQSPGTLMAAPLVPAKPEVNFGGVLADALSGLAGQPGQTFPARPQSAGPGYEKPHGWKLAAGIFGDAMLGLAGKPAEFAPMMEHRRQEQTAFERGEQQYHRRRADELVDRAADASKPQFFAGNEDRIMYDPTTRTARKLYDAPTDAQTYADMLGLQPGSAAYGNALRDYVLRSNGPTALSGRYGLEAVRNDGRQALQSQRLGVTRRGQDLSHNDRVRGQDLSHGDRMRGQDMSDRRGRYGRGFSGGKGSVSGDGAVAVNKATGERMILRGGQWVPYQ